MNTNTTKPLEKELVNDKNDTNDFANDFVNTKVNNSPKPPHFDEIVMKFKFKFNAKLIASKGRKTSFDKPGGGGAP